MICFHLSLSLFSEGVKENWTNAKELTVQKQQHTFATNFKSSASARNKSLTKSPAKPLFER